MKRILGVLVIVVIFACIVILGLALLGSGSTDKEGEPKTVVKTTDTVEPTKLPTQEPTPEPKPTPVPYWISGFNRCPTSEYYKDLETDTAGIYSEIDMGPQNVIMRIPHGSQIRYFPDESDESMCRVDYGDVEGFVQCMFLVDYDPEEGVRPDESQCW